MIKLLLLMWWVVAFAATVRGEVIERAYYFGVQDLRSWRFEPEDDSDPFAVDEPLDAEADERPQILPLGEAPFKSHFFSEGDQLFDLTKDFSDLVLPDAKVVCAIYNQTSGRIVLRGNEDAHFHMKSLMEEVARSSPYSIQLGVKVFQEPRKGIGVGLRDGRALLTNNKSMAELEVLARPGVEADVLLPGGVLDMNVVAQAGREFEWVDIGLHVSGVVRGRSFELATGLTCARGIPSVVEMGSLGDNDVLVLCVIPEIVFMGGVKWSEGVLDSNGRSLEVPDDFLRRHQFEEVRKVDPKTGKVFQNFSVPPTFIDFLDAGGDSGESDPFATDEEDQRARPTPRPSMKKWDARVIARPGDRVIDMKPLLELQGVQFAKGDFACLVENTSILYAELSLENMELMDAILVDGLRHPPRLVMCSIALVQSDEKIEGENLNRDGIRCLRKATVVARPGQNASLVLEEGFKKLSFEVEPQVGANDNIIDLMGILELRNGDSEELHWKSGVTLVSGKSQVVQSYQKDGKWYALLVEARAESLTDWLLGK